MSIPPPPPGSVADLVLREYLFGNPMNPQDKGIIGQLQDRVNTLIRWLIATFFIGLTAVATFVVDIMVRTGNLHG